MPVNLYDDRKVSLRRPHGNGDLDIFGASYTRRNANVTEALMNLKIFASLHNLMKDISMIDSFQAQLPVQYASNIELWHCCCD